MEELIPRKWKLVASTTGDLNRDGVSDLVFVVQDTDKRNLELSEGPGTDTVDLNPRILGIYFGSSSGNYTKQVQANEFILLRDSPAMDEPLDGIHITGKGVLQIDFRLWYSVGSWTMSSHTYRFRFRNNRFELIGYDANETHRATGETIEHSINFASRKMSITKGNVSEEKPRSVEWKALALDALKTIESLNKPFEWEFEGIYL